MEIKVEVKSECKYTGVSYTTVKITEDEIRELAEKRVADSYMDSECVTLTAQEMTITNYA